MDKMYENIWDTIVIQKETRNLTDVHFVFPVDVYMDVLNKGSAEVEKEICPQSSKYLPSHLLFTSALFPRGFSS